MKKLLCIAFLMVVSICSGFAQSEAEQDICDYRFDEALEKLEKQRGQLVKDSLPTDSIDRVISEVTKAQSSFKAVARTVIIDSVLCPRDKAYDYIRLSRNMGEMSPASTYFKKPGLPGAVFVPELKDRMYLSEMGTDSLMHIFVQYELKGNWAEKTPLQGLSEKPEAEQDYPFMMSDGLTFYFAMKGENGMGGYDIFKTRYDIDEHRFLKPENMGMPFNSPANDYLFTIDEERNIGWFATDRGMSGDSVKVFTFIPDEVRNIYDPIVYTFEQLRGLARIDSLPATWYDKQMVGEALERAKAPQADYTHTAPSFTFAVSPTLTYHELSDFKSAEAKQAFTGWQEGSDQLCKKQQGLDNMRASYAKSPSSELGNKILSEEEDIRLLKLALRKQETNIREAENKALEN